MSKKERIPINIVTGMANNPFASLSTEGLPVGESQPANATLPAPSAKLGRVVLRRETAHRGGKSVIVVYDFPPQTTTRAQIEALATKLKKACGCGGTVKAREIEIQGDQPGKIRALLEAEGYRVAGIK
jgi:translation initiation factor 1